MNLFWLITDFCNLKCKYCYYNVGIESREGFMDEKKIDLYLSKLLPLGIKKITLTGGEVFFNKKTKDAIFYLLNKIKDLDIKVNINSNATNIDIETIRFLKELPNLDNLFISLDSINEDENNFLREGSKDIPLAIKRLIEHGINVSVLITLTKKNIDSLKDTYKSLKANGATQIFINPVSIPENNKYYQDLNIDDLGIKGYIKLKNTIFNFHQPSNKFPNTLKYYNLWLDYYSNMSVSNEALCQMGKDTFVLLPNGKIKNCFHDKKYIADLNVIKSDQIGKVIDFSKRLNLKKNIPECFSKNCISLFAIDDFWNN